jgi:hypothetical protein
MANFFTDIAPNVIFSKDPTAVIDYYVQHKLPGCCCNWVNTVKARSKVLFLKYQLFETLINPIKMAQLGCN